MSASMSNVASCSISSGHAEKCGIVPGWERTARVRKGSRVTSHGRVMPGGLKFGLGTNKKQVYGLIQPSQFSCLEDDDTELDIQKQIDATNRRREKRAKKEIEKVLSVDSSAYQYDEVYDEMKTPAAQKELAHERDKKERKPRYIEALMDQAKEREMEQNIIYDRMKVKEIEREKEQYGETEKFVTGAYRRELEKRKKWLETRDAKDAMDKDVRKEGDFRLKLMSSVMGGRNVAAGGTVEERTVDTTEIHQVEATCTTAEDGVAQGSGSVHERSAVDGERPVPGTTEEETSKRKSQGAFSVEADPKKPKMRAISLEVDEHLDPLLSRQARKERMVEEMSKRRNDEDSVSAARARYLERKRQMEQEGK